MVKLTKLYTKVGDRGTTHLVGGSAVSKASPRVNAYGDIDELNATIGLARTHCDSNSDKELSALWSSIQNWLFDLGAELASPPAEEKSAALQKISDEHVAKLEEQIDKYHGELPELNSFVLPGGTELNARLHLARTVCRRAERTILSLHQEEPVREEVIRFVNRLSDLLFAVARFDCHRQGKPEYLWDINS